MGGGGGTEQLSQLAKEDKAKAKVCTQLLSEHWFHYPSQLFGYVPCGYCVCVGRGGGGAIEQLMQISHCQRTLCQFSTQLFRTGKLGEVGSAAEANVAKKGG